MRAISPTSRPERDERRRPPDQLADGSPANSLTTRLRRQPVGRTGRLGRRAGGAEPARPKNVPSCRGRACPAVSDRNSDSRSLPVSSPDAIDAGRGEGPVDLRGTVRRDPDRTASRRRRAPATIPWSGASRMRARRVAAVDLDRRDPDPDDALAEEQLIHRPFADEAAGRDDPDHVGELLHLAEDVARDEHRLAGRGEVAEGLAHGHDAGRIEPVGRLVEQEQARIAQQGGRDAQALLHPERVALDLVPGAIDPGRRARAAPRPGDSRCARRSPPGRAGSPDPRGMDRTTAISINAPTSWSRRRSRRPNGRPSSSMVPASGLIRPVSNRIVVVFPAPFGPRKP